MEEIDAGKLPPEAIEHIRCQAFVLREHGHMTMWPCGHVARISSGNPCITALRLTPVVAAPEAASVALYDF